MNIYRNVACLLLCFVILLGCIGCGDSQADQTSKVLESGEMTEMPEESLPQETVVTEGTETPDSTKEEETTSTPETTEAPFPTDDIGENSVGLVNIKTNSGQITGAEDITIPRPVQSGRTLMADTYLSPEKTGLENASAFSDMVAMVKASYGTTEPYTKIDIPNGTYRIRAIKSYGVHLNELTNLCIEGNGSHFIFEETETSRYDPSYFRIENCDTVELRNFSVDFDWEAHPMYVIGEVISSDPSTNSVTFRIDSHKLPKTVTVGGGRSWDPDLDNRSDTVGFVAYHAVTGTEVLDEHTLRVTYAWPKSAERAQAGQQFQFYFKANFSASGFDVYYNKNITLDGITIYSTPYEAGWCGATDGYHVANCKVIPAEGRRFSTYTGFETHAVRGNVIFENCEFYGILDDNIHMSNHFMGGENVRISEYTMEMRHLQTWSTKYFFEEGKLLGLYDEKCQPTGWSSRIVSVTSVKEPTNDMATYTVVFADPLPDTLPENCKFFSEDYYNGSYIIRNNSFGGGLCHALYIGLGNGTIENNTFDNFAYPSLVLTTVTRWDRWHIGTGVENVVIRNNVMTRCNTAGRDPASFAVVAGVDKQPTDFYPVDGYVIRNVLVENNVVDGSTGSAFALFSAEDVIVRNNKFLNSNTLPTTKPRRKGWGNAYITEAKNILWQNNVIENEGSSYESGLYIDAANTENIVLDD